MIKNLDNFEDLPPERARYVLAETKLKLMNLMSQLEFLEAQMAQRDKTRYRTHADESIKSSSPVNH